MSGALVARDDPRDSLRVGRRDGVGYLGFAGAYVLVPVGEQEELALDLLGRRLGVKAEDGDAVLVDRARQMPPRPARGASG